MAGRPPVDMTGQRFGRLSVIRSAGSSGHYQALWLCACICGKTKVVVGSRLRRGAIKSCGCLRTKKGRTKVKPNFAFSPPRPGNPAVREVERYLDGLTLAHMEYAART